MQTLAHKKPPQGNVTDIEQLSHYSTLSNQTGFMADWNQHQSFLNLPTEHSQELQKQEVEHFIAQLHRNREERYQHVLRVFKQRFEADKAIFAQFDERAVFQLFEIMTRQMLVFFPTRISADVTDDASVILQAHFGDLHFYWETFLEENESIPHSTLNVFRHKQLIFTSGDYFTETHRQFINFITPLAKELIRLDIR